MISSKITDCLFVELFENEFSELFEIVLFDRRAELFEESKVAIQIVSFLDVFRGQIQKSTLIKIIKINTVINQKISIHH